MQTLQTFIISIVIGLTVTALIAPVVIQILYKFNFRVSLKLMKDNSNAEFIKIHGHKTSTPTLGGIMIAVSVFLTSLLLIPESDVKTVFLLFWGLFFLYGLADGILVYGRKLSARMKKFDQSFGWRLTKLFALYFLVLFAVIATISVTGLQNINLFGLMIELTPFVIGFGAFCALIAVYGIEITDGADGLVTGQFLVGLFSYAVVLAVLGHIELLAIVGLTIGSLIVYLYFNINPARVFMGGTGTFPVAFLLVFVALVTNTIDVFFVMGMIFWAEVTSSTLQILSLKFRKKKLFRIAPIHHYFEAIGWPETKMVQRFWLFSAIFAILSLAVFVLSR